jgi:hypothetical protein
VYQVSGFKVVGAMPKNFCAPTVWVIFDGRVVAKYKSRNEFIANERRFQGLLSEAQGKRCQIAFDQVYFRVVAPTL